MLVRVISYIVVTLFALMCILPFLLMISASFSTETIINKEGFGLLPKGLTVAAYSWVFRFPKMILGSYGVTILMTVGGTILGLFIIAMTGYALQRQDFPFRNAISFFIYFTTLFSAGMAPTFIWVSRYLHLKGNYMAVFLQLLMTPWLIILMKNFDLISVIAGLFVVMLVFNLATGRFVLGFDTPGIIAHSEHLWNILGMYTVGFAAVLAGGCPLRQLILAGQGSSDSAVTVVGMFVGAAMCHNFGLAASGTALNPETKEVVAGAVPLNGKIACIICIVICFIIAFTNKREETK